MEIFIARQPIFDRKQHVIAYELLYRAANQETSNFLDGDSATSSVIVNSLLTMGLDSLTDQKLAFVNFTKNLIDQEVPTVFSNEFVVVELLEDIVPDDAFIDAVKKLKAAGYTIALDDFELDNAFPELVELADIIKVDFLLSDREERKTIVEKYKHLNIRFLAEKVETHKEFQEAIEQGYMYFQGYFFAKPKVVSGRDVQSMAINYIKILNELNQESPEYKEMAAIIESDLALSYKLLRLINSAAFYTNSKITSINHALVLLGFKEIRKWISLIMLRDIGTDKPQELVRVSLVRAKCMESMAKELNMMDRKPELFLMGMFSLIDTLMDRPMEDVLDQLPLCDEVKNGLMGKQSPFKDVLSLVKSYEKGCWEIFFKKCDRMKIKRNLIPDIYVEALGWVRSIFDLS